MGYDPLEDFMRIGTQASATPPDHPDPEVLLAYHAGELAGADAERVRGHIGGCTVCRQRVDNFVALSHFEAHHGAEDVRHGDAELAADWADLLGRLHRDDVRPGVVQRHRATVLAWLPLVASLSLAAGLGWWGWWEHRQAQEPLVNVHTVDISVQGVARGDEWPNVLLPATGGTLRFDLGNGLAGGGSAETYRLTIRSEGERVPQLVKDGLLAKDGALWLLVKPAKFPPGPYTATVQSTDASDTRVWEYSFELKFK